MRGPHSRIRTQYVRVVQRLLRTSSWPRFARKGDSNRIGVTVTINNKSLTTHTANPPDTQLPGRLLLCSHRQHLPRVRPARCRRHGNLLQPVLLQLGRLQDLHNPVVHRWWRYLGRRPGLHQRGRGSLAKLRQEQVRHHRDPQRQQPRRPDLDRHQRLWPAHRRRCHRRREPAGPYQVVHLLMGPTHLAVMLWDSCCSHGILWYDL